MTDRSARAEVRNPVLALPSMKRLQTLPAPIRDALADILSEIAVDARTRAQMCWEKHKAPMAAYWKAVSVYAGHISRAVRKQPAAPAIQINIINHSGEPVGGHINFAPREF